MTTTTFNILRPEQVSRNRDFRDVAGLEGGIVGQQVEDRIAHHLDLAGHAVAGVHLEAAVERIEARPKVGLAVIHPLLTSREDFDMYSAAGLRTTLEDHGFEVVDVILKKWGQQVFDDYDRYLSTCVYAFDKHYQSLAQYQLRRID